MRMLIKKVLNLLKPQKLTRFRTSQKTIMEFHNGNSQLVLETGGANPPTS